MRTESNAHGNRWSYCLRPILVIAWLCAPAGALAEPPEQYPFLAYDDGLRQARELNKRIFLYFGRYGCGWCDLTNKKAFSDPEIRRKYVDHYVLVYVDAESGKRLTLPTGERITEMELGVRFKAFATPLFAYLESDGRLIFKVAGIQTIKDFNDYDRFVHGGVYRSKDIKQYLSENP
jgi:thioredoxin-related protein